VAVPSGPLPPVSPAFRLAANFVVALMIVSLLALLYLSHIQNPTPAQSGLIETLSTTWKMGFGAFIGLIGGKAL